MGGLFINQAMCAEWASMAAEAPSFGQILATIRLDAAAGRLETAKVKLRALLADQPAIGSDLHACLQACAASIHCGDWETTSDLLTTACGGLPSIRLDVQPEGARSWHENALRCQTTATSVQIVLSRTAYASRHLPFFIWRLLATLPLFGRCFELGLLGEGGFMLNIGDSPSEPGLAFCTMSDSFVLIPDADFLRSHGYAATRTHFADNAVPWERRRKIAFWRGATTGRPVDMTLGWRSKPRCILCQRALDEGPELFDVGLSDLELAADDPARQEIPLSGLMRPRVPITAFQNFRYHIDIDGHTNAWSGLFQKLLTGCPVLKVTSPQGWRQWYYDKLVPWENFVPIQTDLSDLARTVRWLMAHDGAARRIGEAGLALAESLSFKSELTRGAQTIGAMIERAGTAPWE